ncbi:quinone oxidoreductase family protein [Halorussus marinus]|uniref:quinone oxidoreductase family protein n=1 Tax=Halorussus marinus TaxID=2505976 RepID=UPI00106E9808|nr:NADPH:quinone oxidoreductase family protein [Halorussus marinus]
MNAIQVTEFGDSDALEVIDAETPEPDAGQVRIDVEAAGINFADIMQRRGHYKGGPTPPFVPGMEAAGTVDAVGEGADAAEGDRVVAMTGVGGYAEYALADADSLFEVPESMEFEAAAGFPVQFLTAHAVLHEWGGLEAGENVLVHAAAGGVGTAAVQLAAAADATVFGTASTGEKLELAEGLGCDHPINYETTDLREVVAEETDGAGVDLVLDGVGGDAFSRSVDALAHFGRIVTYGAASGVPGQVDTTDLLFENKSVRGFHLGNALERTPERVLQSVPELQKLLAAGDLEVVVGDSFDLTDAAAAHEAIESRETVGKVVLTP